MLYCHCINNGFLPPFSPRHECNSDYTFLTYPVIYNLHHPIPCVCLLRGLPKDLLEFVKSVKLACGISSVFLVSSLLKEICCLLFWTLGLFSCCFFFLFLSRQCLVLNVGSEEKENYCKRKMECSNP